MKLIPINKIEIGQIYKDENSFYVIAEQFASNGEIDRIEFSCDEFDLEGNLKVEYRDFGWTNDFNEFDKKNKTLIGKVGISHIIQDNKLIEIPRKEFEVDDIIEYGKGRIAIITEINNYNKYGILVLTISKYNTIYKDSTLHTNSFKNIGILGITHEFVNDKLLIKE